MDLSSGLFLTFRYYIKEFVALKSGFIITALQNVPSAQWDDSCTIASFPLLREVPRLPGPKKTTFNSASEKDGFILTRPDTRQSSRGRLGRSGNAKTARRSTKFVTYRPTNRPTNTTRCRVACPRLKAVPERVFAPIL